MGGLGPKRTRYAGADFSPSPIRRRFKSGGKGGAQTPAAVDPFQLASTQAQANIATAQKQSELNNVRTTSPLAKSFFEQGPDGRWSLNQELDPSTQPVYQQQTELAARLPDLGYDVANIAAGPALGGAAITDAAYNNILPSALLPRADLQNRLDFSGLGTLPSSQTGFGPSIEQAQNAAYDTSAGFLDPQFAQKRSDLRQQLADQGIGIDSDAYSRAQGDLGRQETLAYKQAQDAAVAAGNEQQARLFAEDLSARQQGASEIGTAGNFRNAAEQQLWQDPLTALASLAGTGTGITGSAAQDLTTLNPLSGFEWAGALPTFGGSPTAVSPANVVGAGQVANQAAANRFTAQNTLNNQLFNGLGTLGGAANTALGGGATGGLLGSLFSPASVASADFGGGGAALGIADALGGSELASAATGASFWIVCTELMRQGEMPKRHWIAGAPVFAAYPEIVKRGYYVWAIPSVRHLRRSPTSFYSRILGSVFRWRAEDIAARKGVKGARKLWRGVAVTALLWPICAAIGAVSGAQDWTSVYREEQA